MNIITSPKNLDIIDKPTVFLAGGISYCPDWQKEFIDFYIDTIDQDITIINPRREIWDNNRNNDDISKEQIEWENNYLKNSTGVVFWFPKETLCPITLFELGAALHSQNVIAIGIHPEYQRKLDVETQTKLVNKNIPIVYTVEDLVDETIEYFKNYKTFEDYDNDISKSYDYYRKGLYTKTEVDDIVTEIQMEQYSNLTDKQKIEKAKEMIITYGGVDGSHHKDWTLDQTFRVLSGDRYNQEIYNACYDEETEEFVDEWNVGIAP